MWPCDWRNLSPSFAGAEIASEARVSNEVASRPDMIFSRFQRGITTS